MEIATELATKKFPDSRENKKIPAQLGEAYPGCMDIGNSEGVESTIHTRTLPESGQFQEITILLIQMSY